MFFAKSREIVEEAFAGDIIGIPNHGTLKIGDTLTAGESLRFTGIPSFAPEIFRRVLLKSPLKAKALAKGLTQLAEEGAIQVFKMILGGEFIVGVVGQLQLEVMKHRLLAEYSVEADYEAVDFSTRAVGHSDHGRQAARGNPQDDGQVPAPQRGQPRPRRARRPGLSGAEQVEPGQGGGAIPRRSLPGHPGTHVIGKRLLPIAFALTGCATVAPVMPEPPPPTIAPPPWPGGDGRPTTSTWLDTYDTLVATIREYHEPAEPAFANLGRNWDDDVAALRRRMAEADGVQDVQRVLDALQNSLLDRHLRYQPAVPDAGWAVLPIGLVADPTDEGFRLLIADVRDPKLPLAVGDAVAAIDSVPTRDVLHRHRFATAANQPRAHADAVARSLTQRRLSLWPNLVGRPVTLSVAGKADVTVRWEGRQPPAGLDEGLALELRCDGVPRRDYGSYRLFGVGINVCLYASDDPAYAPYPIVRHHGFLYEGRHDAGRLARLDRTLVAETLAERKKVAGVVLDLRDNHGGNNPHVFLDWYAPGPYDAMDVVVRLHESLAERDDGVLERILWSSRRAERYRALQAEGKLTWSHPFLCPDEACTKGHRHEGGKPVTKAPIALLVGPMCISSCDTFAAVFAREKFGPLVGEPTAAAYTVNRLPIEVTTKGGTELGTFHVAISRARFGEDGPWLEGAPLPVDVVVPRRWETRDEHDRALVDAAIARLRRR